MPGKTTSASAEAVASTTVRKNSLEGGATSEWDTCQDSPQNWGRERGDSMKSGSSKGGENGSVLSKSSDSTADASIATAGSIETAKEPKEKEHVMKRTSSWMKNIGNGMRTLRLRKGSGSISGGSKKRPEILNNSILDEESNTSTNDNTAKVECEVKEETPPLSNESSPSVSTSSFSQKFKRKDKKKKQQKEDASTATNVIPPVPEELPVVPGNDPVPEPNAKPALPAVPELQKSKGKKRVKESSVVGTNGTTSKPIAGNPVVVGKRLITSRMMLPMQTLRRRASPLRCTYKTDPARFIGEGLCFKAKLIGVLEVSGPRGDRICQEALSELKMAVKAAGEHKQKVTIHVALDGLRLRDEKTGDCLYHHQVHKISFIAQDLTDTRAFGYIFGSPDTGHRFFGIKTEKSASQVVMAMRDLFQVVFDLKKKEIERAKQQLEMQQKFLATRAAESTTPRSGKSEALEGACATSAPAEADLLNLEVELNSLQEGLENIHSNLVDSNTHNSMFNRGSTASISSDPMNPMSPGFKYSTVPGNTTTVNSNSTNPPISSTQSQGRGNMNSFGDSFDPFDSNTGPAKLWPAPFTSDPFSQVDPFAQVDPFPAGKFNSFDSGQGELFGADPFETSSGGVNAHETTGNSITSSHNSISKQSSQSSVEAGCPPVRKDSIRSKLDNVSEIPSLTSGHGVVGNGPSSGVMTGTGWMASFEDNFIPQSSTSEMNGTGASGRTSASLDIFTDLDPLGTGRVRPFVDRKDFFHDLKNPPKKVLNDLTASALDQPSTYPHPTAQSNSKVLHVHLPHHAQEPLIHNSFSTHFNPSSSSAAAAAAALSGVGSDFDSHFKLSSKTNELRTSSIRTRLPSSSGGDSPPSYSPPPPPPSASSVSNSVYFINPPVSQLTPPPLSSSGSSRLKRSPGLLKHITISKTPTLASSTSNSSPKTLPRSTRLSSSEFPDEIPSLTPPPPPRPPPSGSSTLTRASTSAVPRPHSGNESKRQNYATLGSVGMVAPEPPPRPSQTMSDNPSSFMSSSPLVSPPPPLPPKKQVVGPTLSATSILGKLLYTSDNHSSSEVEIKNDLPLPLPSRRTGNNHNVSTTSLPRYAIPAENSTSSPILYNRKRMQHGVEAPVQVDIQPPQTGGQMTMEQALNQVASLSLGQLAAKLGLPVTQLSHLTINQLAEELRVLDLRRNSDPVAVETFESNFDPEPDSVTADPNDYSTASAPPALEGGKSKQPSGNFDKYAVFRELTLEDASGFSLADDGSTPKVLMSMTSRDSSSERTLQADDGPDVDLENPMLSTMDDVTDVNFSDGEEDGNDKSVLDDEVVDLNAKSEWATFESNFDEQFVPLSKAEESPWESDADEAPEERETPETSPAVQKPSQKQREPSPSDQFDFVPFEKPPSLEHRRGSHPIDPPKFQRQGSNSSKHSGHGRTNTSDYSADSGKERPFSGSSSGRRYSRGGESEEDWALAPPPNYSASARKIRSHRHYRDEESSPKPRKREIIPGEDEPNEEEDDRSHASYHSSTNSYSRDRQRPRRYYPPPSSKYYDGRHGGSQSLQRRGKYKGRSGRTGSPYSDHESDFEDSFEDECLSTASGRGKREFTREEYWSAGSRPSSSGSGRRYQQPVGHRDRDRSDYHNSYYSRDHRYSSHGHGPHHRHYRDRGERERDRIRPERREDDQVGSDYSEEDSGRWAGKKPHSKRPHHPQTTYDRHRGDRERDSRHRYYYTNSPSYDSESPPPPEVDSKKSGGSRGGGNKQRPSSATHPHHNNSFVNTPPLPEERSGGGSGSSRKKGNAKYQSELALNTSRKLSGSEFRFEENDFDRQQRPSDEPLSLPDTSGSASGRISETSSTGLGATKSSTPKQRPPESPFEDNFVAGEGNNKEEEKPRSGNESNGKRGDNERDIFFPAKFDFDAEAVHQMKLEEEERDNSLDVSDKSVESLQETPDSVDTKKSIDSIEAEMKKSNSFNIFAPLKADPFEDDDFFK